MSWLRHPKYRRLCEDLAKKLRAKDYRFHKVNPVVFLCGGASSTSRDRLASYIRKTFTDLLVFYADDVWSAIGAVPGRNALQMEARLAELADVVIIVVESPGTFAELGAFSLSDPLRKKLMPMVDRSYKSDHSFINTGPLRWIEQDSDFRPTIWVPLNRILEAALEVDERLSLLQPETKTRVSNLAQSPKHLLFFVCDIISIIGPCDIPMICALMCEVLQENPVLDAASLVGLAKTLNLIREINYKGNNYYFSPLDSDGRLRCYHRNKFIDIPGMRAEAMSVLQSIEQAQSVLVFVGKPA